MSQVIRKTCEHLESFDLRKPGTYECAECVKSGEKWVHLRTCQDCGVTLCCDSSVNQHARNHMEVSGHPVVISAEPGEHWAYCYEHQYLKNIKTLLK